MNRNLLFVILALFTWGLGEGLFLYFQPIYLQELGADPVLIGAILGGMGLAMALAQIPAGILSDRIGSRTMMWISWVIGTVAAIVMALSQSLAFFTAGLILYGFSSFSVSPMNRYITSVRGKYSVGRSLTLASGLFNLGAVIGPIAGGFIAQKFNFRTIFFASAVVFAISTIILLTIEKNPPVHEEDLVPNSNRSIYGNRLFLLYVAIVFIVIFGMYLPQPLTPNFLQNQQGYDSRMIGFLGAVGNLGNALLMLFLGTLSPLKGLFIGQVLVTGFSALFLTGNHPFWFAAGYFLFGGFRLSKTMVLAFARQLVHPAETGLAYGVLETVSSMAIILAPVLAGLLYNHSPRLMYEVGFGTVLIGLIVSSVTLPLIQGRSKPGDSKREALTQDD